MHKFVCHMAVLCQNGWTDQAHFLTQRLPSANPILCDITRFGYLQKQRYFLSLFLSGTSSNCGLIAVSVQLGIQGGWSERKGRDERQQIRPTTVSIINSWPTFSPYFYRDWSGLTSHNLLSHSPWLVHAWVDTSSHICLDFQVWNKHNYYVTN